jgi:hypothetical protein
MRQRVRDIMEQSDRRFTEHSRVLPLWQTLAENFHIMRADYTRVRSPSEEFASFLMTGRPALAFRELQNSFSGMLRPRDQQWFHPRTHSEKINQAPNNRGWLDWAGTVQRRIMYEPRAQFVRATKEADGDFCLTGNALITVDPNRTMDGLLFRDWHLRDCAWSESVERAINRLYFKWEPEAHELKEMFGGNAGEYALSPKVIEAAAGKDKFRKIKCRRMIIPADDYDMASAKRRGLGWVSIYIDCENETILEEIATRTMRAVIPRWVTVSGSPIAYSPSAILALPDGRMLQEIALTILEAGQKAVDPPTISVGEAINGGINLYAGGNTTVDADYDERMGEVLRPMTLKHDGLQFAANREEKIEKLIDDAFFRSRIGMPTITKEMTAYETQKMYEDFIRGALPLFEPVEVEYNASICSESFDVARDMGAFGSPFDMPPALRGQELRFEFDSPLQQAAERAKIGYFQQSVQIVAEGAQIDPSVRANFKVDAATRDTLGSVGGPAEWIATEDEANALKAQAAQQAQAAAAAQQMATGADVATKVANAGESAGRAAQMMKQSGMLQ